MAFSEKYDGCVLGEPKEGELRGSPIGYFPESEIRALSLTQCFIQSLREMQDKIIQVYPREGVTWRAGQVLERGLQLAAGLQALGVRPGDRVSLVVGRHPEYGTLYLATLLAGATWAPFTEDFNDNDLGHVVTLLDPRVVLAEAAVVRRLLPIIDQLKEQGELSSDARLVTLCEGEEWGQLSRERQEAEREPLPSPPPDPKEAVAVIAFTSGTSGLPKGVILSHYALLSRLYFLRKTDARTDLESKTILTATPGFWITCIITTLFSMAHDITAIYEYGCSPEEFLESIERYRPQMVITLDEFLLSVAKAHETSEQRRDVSSLRILNTSGAPMNAKTQELVSSVMGVQAHSRYGMTEMCGGTEPATPPHKKSNFVGRLSPFLRCKVVDPDTGRSLGPNEEGEFRFKGPCLTSGYFKNPQATAELFDADGWLCSGDLGHYDADGYLWVTGRKKDLIKYREMIVSPGGIEELLETHPSVLECAVVGVPDALNGELARAYVVLQTGAVATEEVLVRLVQERMDPHKRLHGGVVFLDALPRTPSGKVNRNEILKRYVLPNLPDDKL